MLVSSKTEAEMLPLAEELGLEFPIICENGGLISWRGLLDEERRIMGVPRENILKSLETLSDRFQFRSFITLGLTGIMESTGLELDAAERAAQRMTTEPLIWDDNEDAISEFRSEIEGQGLTLTRGGRFWHIAGRVNKGDGLVTVRDELAKRIGSVDRITTVAVGDSPIDLPMLELAETAIVIPSHDGKVRIHPQNSNVIVASVPGSAGWNETIHSWIDSQQADAT